jgi:hypothetical protein
MIYEKSPDLKGFKYKYLERPTEWFESIYGSMPMIHFATTMPGNSNAVASHRYEEDHSTCVINVNVPLFRPLNFPTQISNLFHEFGHHLMKTDNGFQRIKQSWKNYRKFVPHGETFVSTGYLLGQIPEEKFVEAFGIDNTIQYFKCGVRRTPQVGKLTLEKILELLGATIDDIPWVAQETADRC